MAARDTSRMAYVLARLARAVPRAPRMAARLGPVLARMAAMKALYGTIPRAPEKRRRWSRVVAALFGEASEHA